MKQVPLLNDRGVALVDDEDYERVMAAADPCWRRSGGYASTGFGERQVYMHRLILGLARGHEPEVDHVHGGGLDNRRANLRLADRSQQNANKRKSEGKSSRFKGVSRDRGRWRAVIKVDRRYRHLGSFATEEEAAAAYNVAAVVAFGPFARLNA